MIEPRYVIERDEAHHQWAVIDRATLEVVAEFDKCWQAERWVTSQPEVIDLDQIEVRP